MVRRPLVAALVALAGMGGAAEAAGVDLDKLKPIDATASRIQLHQDWAELPLGTHMSGWEAGRTFQATSARWWSADRATEVFVIHLHYADGYYARPDERDRVIDAAEIDAIEAPPGFKGARDVATFPCGSAVCASFRTDKGPCAAFKFRRKGPKEVRMPGGATDLVFGSKCAPDAAAVSPDAMVELLGRLALELR
jgi:hypothetical protein